jgi:hypothetical protein
MILFKDNDPFHFGTIALSLLNLFRISTLDTWSDIMYINMYGCHRYYYHDSDPTEVPGGYEQEAAEHMHVGAGYTYWVWERGMECSPEKRKVNYYMAPFFFLVFIVVSCFMMLSLFVGVITTSMGDATEEQKKFMEIDSKIKAAQAMFGLKDDQVHNYRVLFAAMDADGGGCLDMDELRTALSYIFPNQTEEEIKEFINKVDRDGGGEVDEAEFVEAIIFSVMMPSTGLTPKGSERGGAPMLEAGDADLAEAAEGDAPHKPESADIDHAADAEAAAAAAVERRAASEELDRQLSGLQQ